MSTVQIVTGNQLRFNKFEDVEKHVTDVLNLVKIVGLQYALSAETRIYSNLVKEFYFNGKIKDGSIVKKVKDTELTISSVDFTTALGFGEEGETDFSSIDTKKALTYMGYKKNK